MTKDLQLRLLPEEAANDDTLRAVVARETGDAPRALRILKRSIDARQRTVYVNVTLRAFFDEEPTEPLFPDVELRDVSGRRAAIVVGAGPGGLFAALRLIELGMRPIVVERGREVNERKRDIADIVRRGTIDPESNYCFGEGGAGAFSDGKLYTRSKKRGSVERILIRFCQHGANPAILYDAHPHIGTDKLPGVIERMRRYIIDCGGEVHFGTCMDGLLIHDDEVTGITTRTGQEFRGPVILATGHSARDVYRMLADRGVTIEAKGIAVGVRLEHPQPLIDRIRYHRREGRGPHLPAAEYTFVSQAGGRGVYSFCMCPGGFVIPASTAPDECVVNGMSPANRGSRWANAGWVVELRPEDLASFHLPDTGGEPVPEVLAMMDFQERLERLCRINAGQGVKAPAQRMADFVARRNSSALPASSFGPGLLASPLHFWMPDFITSRLREGFRSADRVSRGFLTNEAVMIGVETRTSSPVRILRDRETLRHVTLRGLYPCGEGAGYAGGIVSAAIDGERCAEQLAASYGR